jgi:hypothetical protein|tara:strand:+ start:706 stop:960 length:255 start_codon:yes stop_codon:yes gene_type:complete
LQIIRIANNSTLPIIIKIININLDNILRFKKLKSFRPNIEELTVFISVRIPNLKASSILIFEIVNREEIINKEIINTKRDKKYL